MLNLKLVREEEDEQENIMTGDDGLFHGTRVLKEIAPHGHIIIGLSVQIPIFHMFQQKMT